MTTLSDYETVRAVLKDGRFSVGDFGEHCRRLTEETDDDFSELIAQASVNLFVLEGEVHARTRNAVRNYYKPHSAAAWGPVFASIIESHIAALKGRSQFCLIEDLLEPAILAASIRTIGFVPAPAERLRSWIDDFESLIKLMPSLRTLRRIEKAMRDYRSYALATRAVAVNGDPLTLRQHIEQSDDVDWSQREIEHFLLVSLNASWATKRTIGNILALALSGSGLAALGDRTRLRDELNGHLRRAMPIEATLRCPRTHSTVCGQEFQADQNVILRLRAANHDPSQFPDEHDPKQDRTHLTFGAGHHACLGQHVARTLVTEFLFAIGSAFSSARMNGECARLDVGAPVAAVGSLPITLEE
ncbi:cytochrome P450 [Citromicrobium bathyomarinum]|uniref:cytochrome P450 n=1 Tax=Citromicrobium bathyomarinum TaxID=72174 RepID=UPI00315A0401